jgi:hypothetical protein
MHFHEKRFLVIGCVVLVFWSGLNIIGSIFLTIENRSDSPPMSESQKFIDEASFYASYGNVGGFEEKIGKAWVIAAREGRDPNIVKDEIQKVLVRGYIHASDNAMGYAFENASQGQTKDAEKFLRDYELYCKRITREPNLNLIQQVRKMLSEASEINYSER